MNDMGLRELLQSLSTRQIGTNSPRSGVILKGSGVDWIVKFRWCIGEGFGFYHEPDPYSFLVWVSNKVWSPNGGQSSDRCRSTQACHQCCGYSVCTRSISAQPIYRAINDNSCGHESKDRISKSLSCRHNSLTCRKSFLSDLRFFRKRTHDFIPHLYKYYSSCEGLNRAISFKNRRN